jgi:hypothetical protein
MELIGGNFKCACGDVIVAIQLEQNELSNNTKQRHNRCILKEKIGLEKNAEKGSCSSCYCIWDAHCRTQWVDRG